MPALPQPRARVEYQKPSRINAVSVGLLVFLGLLGYGAYSLWPVISLRAAVKGELAEALPRYWRANLRPDSVRIPETTRIKRALGEKLRAQGVQDPKLEIVLERAGKRVAIEARYTTRATFAGLAKTVVVPCSPRVETDAARVEW